MSFAEELYAVVAPHVVMGELLGVPIAPKGETRIRCFRPASHNHGDANPSLDVNGETGLFKCWGCGVAGDTVGLVVALGLASDEGDAIRYLRERYRIRPDAGASPTEGSRAAAPRSGDSSVFPYYRETAEKLGWTFAEKDGVVWAAGPIYDEKGERTGTKHRGPRDERGKVQAYVEGGPGMLGDVSDLETLEPGKIVFVVCGEPDYWALKYFADKDGIFVRAVSHSNGESSSFDIAASKTYPARPIHRLLAGLHVVYVGDVDAPGTTDAAKRITEFPQAERVTNLVLPFTKDQLAAGCKDLRDWLARCGGSVRELLRLVDRAQDASAVTKVWKWLELEALDIATPRELVKALMDEGYAVLIYGDEGVGKSWFAWEWAFLLGLGRGALIDPDDPKRRLFEITSGAPLPVLLVLGYSEDSKARYRYRIRKIAERHGVAPGDSSLSVAWPTFDPFAEDEETAQRTTRLLDDAAVRGGVVVFDNLWSLSGVDLRDDKQAAHVWSLVATWKREFDLAGIIVIAHPRKSGADEEKSAQSMYGSRRSMAAADAIVQLEKGESEREDDSGPVPLTLYVHKVKDKPSGWKRELWLDGATGKFSRTNSDDGGGAPPPGGINDLAIFQALRRYAAAEPLSTWSKIEGAVLEALNRPDEKRPSMTTIRRAIERLRLRADDGRAPWFGHDSSSNKLAIFLRNADGTRWIETEGKDPPPPPLAQDDDPESK